MNGGQSGVSLEVVAAITSALAAMMDRPIGSFTVTGIRPEEPAIQPVASTWSKAGLVEAHLMRRQFGLRLR